MTQPSIHPRVVAANPTAAQVLAKAQHPNHTPLYAQRIDDAQPVGKEYEIHVPHDKGTTTITGVFDSGTTAILTAIDAAIAAGATHHTRKIIVASKAVAA